MKYDSVKSYVHHVGRLIKRDLGDVIVVTDSAQTVLALLAAKRRLGDAKCKARPITIEEVRAIVRRYPHDPLIGLIAIIAFWCGMRMGQLLPTLAQPNASTLLLSDIMPNLDAVVVASCRSKTNLFGERKHTVRIVNGEDPEVCLAYALRRVRATLSLAQLADPKLRLADARPRGGTLFFSTFLYLANAAVPRQPATKFVKGHLTGHSWRRGFVHAALEAGFTIEQIMIHGDWKHSDAVLSFYAVGSAVPSIPLTRHCAVGPGNNIEQIGINHLSVSSVMAAPVMHMPAPRNPHKRAAVATFHGKPFPSLIDKFREECADRWDRAHGRS